MFGGTREKCFGCNKTVYPIEKVTTIRALSRMIGIILMYMQNIYYTFNAHVQFLRISLFFMTSTFNLSQNQKKIICIILYNLIEIGMAY